MSFDSKCYDLAEHFLSDEPALQSERNRNRLAQAIQDAIEDWIEGERPLAPDAGEGEV